jgi:hypothetical protein
METISRLKPSIFLQHSNLFNTPLVNFFAVRRYFTESALRFFLQVFIRLSGRAYFFLCNCAPFLAEVNFSLFLFLRHACVRFPLIFLGFYS